VIYIYVIRYKLSNSCNIGKVLRVLYLGFVGMFRLEI
jgi:hypothetical protein